MEYLIGVYAIGGLFTRGVIYYCEQYEIVIKHWGHMDIQVQLLSKLSYFYFSKKSLLWPWYRSKYETRFLKLYKFFNNGIYDNETMALINEIRNED